MITLCIACRHGDHEGHVPRVAAPDGMMGGSECPCTGGCGVAAALRGGRKPTVPEAAEALREYYRLPHRGMGGCVHIIIEDTNCSQKDADYCASNARHWGENWAGGFLEEDQRIADMLAAMSTTQRRKLSVAYSFYP